MTKTEIANIALGQIGVSGAITDFSERSPEAERVRLHWDGVRDAMLRHKAWSFAAKRQVLSRLADAPEFDFAYAYALPSDYLRAIEFNGQAGGTSEAQYEISGGNLLSDSDVAQLKYTARVENTELWDAAFVDAFTLALAAVIIPGISTSASAGAALRQRAEAAANSAIDPSKREGRPRAVQAQTGSGYMRARQGL